MFTALCASVVPLSTRPAAAAPVVSCDLSGGRFQSCLAAASPMSTITAERTIAQGREVVAGAYTLPTGLCQPRTCRHEDSRVLQCALVPDSTLCQSAPGSCVTSPRAPGGA
eukprot:13391955-Alexandrium_andersonii.AAC.2